MELDSPAILTINELSVHQTIADWWLQAILVINHAKYW